MDASSLRITRLVGNNRTLTLASVTIRGDAPASAPTTPPSSSSGNATAAPTGSAPLCAAVCVSSLGAAGGRAMNAALEALLPRQPSTIHLSLAAAMVALADGGGDSVDGSGGWRWRPVSLGSAVRLHIYGRPEGGQVGAGPADTGTAAPSNVTLEPHAALQAGAALADTAADAGGGGGGVGGGGADSTLAPSAVSAAARALAGSVLDVAGVRNAVRLDDFGSLDSQLLLRDVTLLNLPYASQPQNWQGFVQAMMNWVDADR
jgi:hypothetical protein